MDTRLSEFNEEEVRRIVGIALLCTQTSPTSRPSMSRVVAMLSGDIEVTTVTTKPGYLTEWNFDDVSSSFVTNMGTIGSAESNYKSSASTSTLGGADQSPINNSKPIVLHDTIAEGM